MYNLIGLGADVPDFNDVFFERCTEAVVPVRCPVQGSAGTGFFASSEGLVVTNSHVISDWQLEEGSLALQFADTVVVQYDGEWYRAELLTHPDETGERPLVFDYAILRVPEVENPPVLELGGHDDVHRADDVLCLGYPLDFDDVVATSGVVSIVRRQPSHFNALHNLWSVVSDAVIQFGSSGGPMIHGETGRVVGITTRGHDVKDQLNRRLQQLATSDAVKEDPVLAPLLQYVLKYTYVGLNHAVSAKYAREDPAYPTGEEET